MAQIMPFENIICARMLRLDLILSVFTISKVILPIGGNADTIHIK